MELPLKVTFHPERKKSGPREWKGMKEEEEEEEEEGKIKEALVPLLVYDNKKDIDLYNILEVAQRMKRKKKEEEEEEEEGGAKDPCKHISLQDAAAAVVVVNLYLGTSYVPFLEDVLTGLTMQEYPKEAMHVWIYGKGVGVQEAEIEAFVDDNRASYASVTHDLDLDPDPQLLTARCADVNCSFVALMEPRVALNDPKTLAELVHADKPVVGSVLKQRHGGGEVNFVSKEGEEQSQWDDLIRRRAVRGTLRVAEVKVFRLVQRDYLQDLLQGRRVLHYISTRAKSGLLLDPRSGYKEGRKHADLWGIRHNPLAWKWRYVHPDLPRIINGELQPEEVGKDLYYVPLFTERFCRELIEEMEHYGRWQDKDVDDREEAHRYSSTNINLSQIDLANEYHLLSNTLHKELLATLYGGYRGKGNAALLFVLRYIASEHYNTFTYHLDGATYTMNVALNDDFTGGGLEYRLGNKHFAEEQEIHLPHNRTGWGVVQPNRPFHLHHGVPLKSGRRYALIAIVDTNDEGSKGGPIWE
ncbi:procollagen-lysine,2-oxoglutarate 5-dioxygenase 2-like [Eriocheir sinensis]|uniref:procollagen-lysine,2-oxoglutarate 5-dioxygenase 2-like n=1 Tax=Eriocheir sinensis TaxID=95602 RepID=UPI0021C835AA|nr:procollagen-lysine,2-oxoglutarate 5-dioxygenase 2-like [Eriocheir sinensis]